MSVLKKCVTCESSYETNNTKQRYCSYSCKETAHNLRYLKEWAAKEPKKPQKPTKAQRLPYEIRKILKNGD